MILYFILGHLSVLKGGEELLQGRWTGGGHVFLYRGDRLVEAMHFLLNITLIYL